MKQLISILILLFALITVRANDTVYIQDYMIATDSNTIYIDKRPYRKVPILNIKTNLLTDILLAPNIQLEVYTHVWGLSLEAEYTQPWWVLDDKHIYYQLQSLTFSLRKYFNNEYMGHYVGLYGGSAAYDFEFTKKGWQGELWHVGLTYGYVFSHSKYKRLKFEPYIRIGYLSTQFDTYHAGHPYEGKYYYDWNKRASEFVPRRFRVTYFGPTMVGINISYDLICTRKYLY